MKKRWFLYEMAALFAADQICKAYVEQNIDMGEERKLADHVILRRVHNKGMSLGILSDMPKAVRIFSGRYRDGIADVCRIPAQAIPAKHVFDYAVFRSMEQYI